MEKLYSFCNLKLFVDGTIKYGQSDEILIKERERESERERREKILWEKEKMLVSNIFSFYHNVFAGVSLGKTLQSPSLVLVQPRKDINNVSRRRDMTDILFKK